MPIDLVELVAPAHTAVLTMEMQRGIIGDLSFLEELAAEVSALDVIGHTAELLEGARRAGVRVVHCIVGFRADGAGSAANAPLLAGSAAGGRRLLIDSPETALVPELGPDARDVVSRRSHGLSPFGGTSLDVTLRNMAVSTVVAAGVSLNVGVLGLAIEAVNLGYRVVVATDAVCGIPRDYAEAVMRHSVPAVAARASVGELLAAWA